MKTYIVGKITGVACVNTNRKFIDIENEDNYFDIARKRIENMNRG